MSATTSDQPIKKVEATLVNVAITVCYVQGLMTGTGLLVGIQPRVSAAPGFFSGFLPFLLGPCCSYCLAVAWHWNVIIASKVKTSRGVALALILSAGVMSAGVATSGRFLVAKLDGVASVRAHELAFLDQMSELQRESEAKAANDRGVIKKLLAAEQGLGGTQDNEDKFGTVSKKGGKRGVYDTIGQQIKVFRRAKENAQHDDDRRSAYLKDGKDGLSAARAAASTNDLKRFVQSVNAATTQFDQANRIDLLDEAGSIGSGLITELAREPFEAAKRDVDDFIKRARENSFQTTAPNFRELEPEDAVVEQPPTMAWIMGVTIEGFPMLMVLLILICRMEGIDPTAAL